MKDIFDAYVETCGGAGGCNGTRVGWVGAPGVPNPLPMLVIPEQKSLTDGVKAAFGETSEKALVFLRYGRDYGVSNEL